ncbi:MAG: molybdopterin-dependent oxidoreductase [Coriobacteriia bacterium]|nr:molybdopterin-dependent oxidoreductase [Coriobacteriia bacterium]
MSDTAIDTKASQVSQKLQERVDGAEIRYTVCAQNGCWSACLLRCYVKDGELVAIDNGDPINENDPREDVGITAIREGMIQHRPCVRGRLWRKMIYDPNRALYPQKNIGTKGDPLWEQISWDEALDTIAGKIEECREKYGPFSVHSNGYIFELGFYGGFGYGAWGCCSFAGHVLADNQVLGINDVEFGMNWGTEPHLLLDSKLIIGFGWNPAVTRPEYAYMMTLAKEQGTPIIIIDSRYTPSAYAYATQWIPIRSGTDLSMMMAIANVLFKEDLIDHAYVEKFVEPQGLATWKDHVLGVDDGIDKTPEWAEVICGVPAETIRELARLYGAHHGYSDKNPCYFITNWSVGRTIQGENLGRTGIYLQALTGNIGVAGGHFNGGGGGVASYFPHPAVAPLLQKGMPSHMAPPIMAFRGWEDAVLLKDQLDSGEMSEEEYRGRIGCAAGLPLPNIHMVLNQSGQDNGAHDSNKHFAALKKVDFVVALVSFMDRPEARYADLVLPVADRILEDHNCFPDTFGYTTPTLFATGTFSNYFLKKHKVIDPPGEARSYQWVHFQLAKRLGLAEAFCPRFIDVLDAGQEAWDKRYEEIQQEAYEAWRPVYAEWAAANGSEVTEAPTWEEFDARPIFRVPLKQEPYFPLKQQIDGDVPFNTPSGQIEFYSSFLADPDMAEKMYVFPNGAPSGVCYGGAKPAVISPFANYIEPPDHPLSAAATEYPLRLITPHSFFRQHVIHDSNLWTKDEARHALWINVADARQRGINDGDEIRISTNKGEGIMPAYVTSRIAPGTICMIYGGWYQPGDKKTALMPDGIDMRGAANIYTTSECYPWVVGGLHCANLAQVERI